MIRAERLTEVTSIWASLLLSTILEVKGTQQDFVIQRCICKCVNHGVWAMFKHLLNLYSRQGVSTCQSSYITVCSQQRRPSRPFTAGKLGPWVTPCLSHLAPFPFTSIQTQDLLIFLNPKAFLFIKWFQINRQGCFQVTPQTNRFLTP